MILLDHEVVAVLVSTDFPSSRRIGNKSGPRLTVLAPWLMIRLLQQQQKIAMVISSALTKCNFRECCPRAKDSVLHLLCVRVRIAKCAVWGGRSNLHYRIALDGVHHSGKIPFLNLLDFTILHWDHYI